MATTEEEPTAVTVLLPVAEASNVARAERIAATVLDPAALAVDVTLPENDAATVLLPVAAAVKVARAENAASTVLLPVAVAVDGPAPTTASNGCRTRSISVPDQRRAVGKGMVSGETDGPFVGKVAFDKISFSDTDVR